MTFFAKIREFIRAKKVRKEEQIQSYPSLEPAPQKIAFLGWKEKISRIFSIKRLSLNLQIYFRVSIVFIRKLPLTIWLILRESPKKFRREGSKIKINKKRFELRNLWPHFGISMLSVAVIGTSMLGQDLGMANPKYAGDNIEPSEFSDVAVAADRFTPFIKEGENAMIAQLASTEDVFISDENYIIAPAGSMTEVSPKQSIGPSGRIGYISYQVLGGETLSHVAAKHNLSVASLTWANPEVKDPNIVQPGTTLLIPPRDGMTVVVAQGQSLGSLVNKYSGSYDETLNANGITDPSTIFAGQRILIANGSPPKATPVPSTKIAKKTTGSVKGSLSSPTGPTVASGTFMWPTSGSICQGFRRGHPAIDICAGGSSPPIVASDGGTVIQASYGWNWGYGNTVLISHGNGFETRYAHLRVLNVTNGQKVSKGQLLGYMGTTGNSTGVHLHFEIHYGPARLNPLGYL